MKRKTNEQFLYEMSKNHPTLTPMEEYKNGRTKLKVHCDICGLEFDVQPLSLYMGHGCPKCKGVKKKTTDEFVNEVKEINKDIVVIGEYKNDYTKIELQCSVCGEKWSATPHSLLQQKGCPCCAGTKKKTHNEFVDEIKAIHPDITIVGEYINNKSPVLCLCNKCNKQFIGIPHNMLSQRNGCPNCSVSHGEKEVKNWLDSNNISYIQQHKFDDCIDKVSLPFDFYIPHKNTAIEYDGRQHYVALDYFGGEKSLEYVKKHDKIKSEYCKNNNINLIRIPYWDFNNINKILSSELL